MFYVQDNALSAFPINITVGGINGKIRGLCEVYSDNRVGVTSKTTDLDTMDCYAKLGSGSTRTDTIPGCGGRDYYNNVYAALIPCGKTVRGHA